MNFIEIFRVALEAILSNKVRSGLTMLGVIIGVLAVILLVSIGEGAQVYITKELTGMGTNLLMITPGKTSTSGGFHPPSAGTVRKLTYDDSQALKRRAWLLSDAVPLVFGTGRIKYQNMGRDTMIIGTTPEFQSIRHLFVDTGSYVTQGDVDSKAKIVVLGTKVKEELFGQENALGKAVTLSDARYRVVGVMQKRGTSLGMDLDDIVFIPVTSGQELFDTDGLFEIIASTPRAEDVDRAISQIKEVLIKRHAHKEDFTIQTQGAMLSTMNTILNILTAVLGGIAGISLLVGGIGIMNIMLVSVRERTREIGIRKAIGARNSDIMAQFMIEAITLSGVGGVIGIVLGVGLALLIPMFVTVLPTSISLWSIVMAFTFSMAVGVFFGVYPARKASLQDPISALRYE
ncbi:MAG: multidrug transporter substrate-binding protein [Nitrospirae bacterium]|nr:multidrug transporter substrate-binding protein [Nitrospirota bacterium]